MKQRARQMALGLTLLAGLALAGQGIVLAKDSDKGKSIPEIPVAAILPAAGLAAYALYWVRRSGGR